MKPKRTSDSYKNKSENSLGTEEIIMLREFKNFILRGNVLDLAVGVIIGSAGSVAKFSDKSILV